MKKEENTSKKELVIHAIATLNKVLLRDSDDDGEKQDETLPILYNLKAIWDISDEEINKPIRLRRWRERRKTA